jgi:hypothetical protein
VPNKLDKLLLVAHKFRAWLGMPEGGCYNEYLYDYRVEILDKLGRESDTVGFHRLQGALSVVDNLLELRGEMDLYIKGVMDGTMRKVESQKENGHAVGR